MNKKGFTWIVGALMLIETLGRGSAQITVTHGTDAPDLPAGSSGRLYQLWAETVGGVSDLLLNVDERGFLYVCPAAAYPETFGSSLWCIQSYVPSEGGNTRFDFTSKTQGYTLAVSEKDAVPLPLGDSAVNVLKGGLMGWGFSLLANPLQKQRALYTQFSTDSVLALTAPYNSAGKYYVKAKKFSRMDVEFGGKAYNDPEVLKFTIVQPAPHVLKAYDFNTLLVSPVELFRKLTFSNTASSGVGSPWSDNALWATDDTAHFVNDNLGWVRFNLNTTNETNKYLRVDTSYVAGTNSLAFKFDVHPDLTALPNQYLFRLMYDVFNDSLAIDVAQAIFPKGDKYFSETVPTTWEGGYSTMPGTIKRDADFLHVKLQDSVITIGESPVATKAMFNIKGCGAPIGEGDGLDSKANGLYTIRNSAGQILGVPVYTDTIAPKWLTLEENVEPNRIPAYQWVVVKTKGADPDSISPIEIYNREFPEQIYTQRIQLFKDQAANLFGDKAYNFTPVRSAEMSDPYLGYKYVDASSAKFNVYEFNFLHDFNDTRFLTATIQHADTMLCIGTTNTERSQFQLIHQGDKAYGYYNGYKGLPEITGLATLKRAAYIIRVNDIDGEPYANKYIALGQEDRYTAKDAAANASVFLLKTNNTKADVDYYAALELNSDAKLGIDNDLWAYVQKQKDTRTSAFSLTALPVATGPLYRRLDGGEYGYSLIKEPFGNAANTPQWLQFTKQSNSGKEFLFENSPFGRGNALGTENDYRQDIKNKTISFLGLYDKDKPPETSGFGYTFYVDTAYVRGNTQKPQYMLAVRPVVQPAFVRGYYVFNAQDSIGRMDEDNYYLNDYVGKFDYGAEYTTRLAFVDGVHLADTFYVLREKIATEDISPSYLAKISLGDKIYLGDNTHYKPRWNRNRTIDGAAYTGTVFNDEYNGKSMVFQFRLVSPDENDRRFLIESRQEDGEIAPTTGRWMQIRNGVPIISDAITWTEATQNNGADIFNVIGGDQGQAVAGESVVTTGVKVISEAGAVTILNAAGKTVAISNILGQTVAGAVIASDNVTIPLPKGIVIVAIKGEPAVKAIVK